MPSNIPRVSTVGVGSTIGVGTAPGGTAPGGTTLGGTTLGGNTLGERQMQERERIESMRRREDEAKNQQKVLSLETEKNRLESEVGRTSTVE